MRQHPHVLSGPDLPAIDNNFETVISRIDIVRAVDHGETYQMLAFVRLGGDILLRIRGWPKVEQVLQAIDAVEALRRRPDQWRDLHNSLLAGEPSRRYSREQHRARLLRRTHAGADIQRRKPSQAGSPVD
jgi:hypothetical protein